MILDYEPGDKVTNPNNKSWGIGQVQSIINGKVTINFEKGSTNYTQLWLASKSANAPIIVLLGESTAGCGLLTWTSSTGILWQNNFTSEATFVYCSALRLQSGDIDF